MMAQSEIVFLGLGSNLGNRRQYLRQAIDHVKTLSTTPPHCSACYESLPFGGMEQPLYVNQIIQLQTLLSPELVLEKCLAIEHRLGRVRRQKWEPRLIDIDLLFYGSHILETEQMIVPHPEFHHRSFVLVPMLELAPDWVDPRSQKTILQLWEDWKQTHQEPLPQILQA